MLWNRIIQIAGGYFLPPSIIPPVHDRALSGSIFHKDWARDPDTKVHMLGNDAGALESRQEHEHRAVPFLDLGTMSFREVVDVNLFPFTSVAVPIGPKSKGMGSNLSGKLIPSGRGQVSQVSQSVATISYRHSEPERGWSHRLYHKNIEIQV